MNALDKKRDALPFKILMHGFDNCPQKVMCYTAERGTTIFCVTLGIILRDSLGSI